MKNNPRLGSSFRDPSGFLFREDGEIYRQVNGVYSDNYDLLMNSGLYSTLVEERKLLPHTEASVAAPIPDQAYKVIKPDPLIFVSYPYEWCFSQLKDAALLTLSIQKKALQSGMSLKDSSAYNIQFYFGRPILIDTLSFEKYREGEPWIAYRQFCQHFLAPLALSAFSDVRLSQLLRVYLDGIPLDLASKLLPARTYLIPSLFMHIHLHSKAQKRFKGKKADGLGVRGQISRTQMLGLIESLEIGIRKLNWKHNDTGWANYYETADHYTEDAISSKRQIVEDFIHRASPKLVWDLGANAGMFSRIAAENKIHTVAYDLDPGAVERNYLDAKQGKEENLLPLLMDLTNPSPALGWASNERMSLSERGPCDLTMALALIHHIAISNNVPFDMLAAFLARITDWLIIEFVPRSDSQVELLLSTREDIFPGYTRENFEHIFSQFFDVIESRSVRGTHRTIYLMKSTG